MGKKLDLSQIENAQLTSSGNDSDLAYLKSMGARALPSNPTANNWSADAIKRQLYKQAEVLFEWSKASNEAVSGFASEVDDYLYRLDTGDIVVDKSRKDAEGNTITETYETKADATSKEEGLKKTHAGLQDQIIANLETLTSADSAIKASIVKEHTAWNEADTAIKALLSEEASTREASDEAIKVLISEKETEAKSLISKETSDRNAKEQALQDAIDAINASQNFVATYASKADMPTPPVSGLEEKDCVLVLKDESKQDQAYVYKYASTGWIEVGPLGDYYTKAEIKDMHASMEKEITAVDARVDDVSKIAWRTW